MTPAARHAPQNARSVWSIPLQSILPNPRQPRRTFDEAALGALAASIRQLGLLQPVAVRAVDASRYELIAGERRLRACALLGMTHIDALVLPATALGSALLALVENLQREDLHYLEEAQGYADVLREEGMTQERLARQIGKSQSAVANKLRLLRLEAPVGQALRAYDLGERHARALLRLPLASLRLEAVQRMGEQRLTARQAEALVLSLLSALQQDGRPARRVLPLMRDHRLYLNAIRDVVRQMRKAGLDAEETVREQPDCVEIIVRMPRFSQKTPPAQEAKAARP